MARIRYTDRLLKRHKEGTLTAGEAMGRLLVDTFDPTGALHIPMDEFFASRLVLKNKRGTSVPFVLNRAQWHFIQNRTRKDIILKARQMGFSTVIQGDHYFTVYKNPGMNCVTLADNADNTAHLVDMFKRFHKNMRPSEQPYMKGRFPAGLEFPDRDSSVFIGTAGNRTWGRSKTTQRMHGSEVAYWPDARSLVTGILESIPFSEPDAKVWAVMESTANGRGGYYYEQVMGALKGLNDWKVHFYAWWWEPMYREALEPNESIEYTEEETNLIKRVATEGFELTPEQIKWRRLKIREHAEYFQQEYPESISQAFLYSGRPRFSLSGLEARINTQCAKPVLEDMPVYTEGQPFYQVRIYERPIQHDEYVIGADTAEGIRITDGGQSDYSAAVVRNTQRNRQVATVQGRFEPYEFAYILQQVGLAYNKALVGVERNNHGHSVLGFLIHGSGDGRIKSYPNIYTHLDDQRAGWPTNVKTRPDLVNLLALEYRDPLLYFIHDEAIVNEAMSFVVHENGKAQAMAGSYDDLVIADGIAAQMRVRLHQSTDVVYAPVSIGDF